MNYSASINQSINQSENDMYLAAGFLEPMEAAVGEVFGESRVRLALLGQLKYKGIL